jgi:acetyl-CoA synthetase
MSDTVESSLQENRRFAPPADFAARAYVGSSEHYQQLHARSIQEPEAFWAEVASDLHWFEPWDQVLEWDAPDARWFVGGKTNLCFNCLDRQVEAGLGDQPAIIWEAEPPRKQAPGDSGGTGGTGGAGGTGGGDAGFAAHVKTYTYADLLRETGKFANVLKSRGVGKGDVVTIYMGMVPELAIAMLACARIGAVHSIIFGGFSANAIRDRVEDGQSKLLITCDGSWRRGKNVPLKANVDEALTMTDLVQDVIVFRRTECDVEMVAGRDHWWHERMADASPGCPTEPMDSEDLLFILYTSGSTGKPKGIMHTTGGYMVHTYMTSKLTFDLKGYRGKGAEGHSEKPSWLTPPDDSHSAPQPLTSTKSTRTGARPTSAGSPGTAISSTGCCPTACPR